MSYFKIAEFCIAGDSLPIAIADKLLEYHINPILPIRARLGFPIWPSKKSGYRSRKYEVSMGRTGTSQHCFDNKGAVDWTCRPDRLLILLNELASLPYTRICYYPEKKFIHCDYKLSAHRLYVCNDNLHWERLDSFNQ